VMLMGLIQIAMGLAGVGNLVRLVPVPVEIGFANGLAIVIALSQFSSYKLPGAPADGHPEGNSHVPEAFKVFVGGRWESGVEGAFAGIITALAFLISVFLPRLTQRIPSALTGILVGAAFEWAVVRAAFGSHTTVVGELGSAGGSFPLPVWFESRYHMPALGGEVFGKTYKLALVMAVVGILESAMTLSLIDERTKTKGNVMRECVGQGIANVVCGALGGMGGCAMLGQSMINVSAGARHRLSTLTCSLFLLFILLVAYPAINVLPVAALAGVMMNVVVQTFEWGSLKMLLAASLPQSLRSRLSETGTRYRKIRRVDAFVIVLVTIVTLVSDLAVAVGCGVLMSCLMHIYEAATMIGASSRVEVDEEGKDRVKIYNVHGVLFFGSSHAFLELFDVEGDPEEVRVIFEASYISDYSALEALNKLGERYGALGKRVTLQLLQQGSSRIVSKAQNLLTKELTLASEGEKVLDVPRFRHNIEGYRQTFTADASAGEDSETVLASRASLGSLGEMDEAHVRHRRSVGAAEQC